MRIELLGDLVVRADDGRELVVSGAKLRALLTVLALHAGRAVSADQLVDALWGEDPPPAARNGVQGLVSKLRRALGSTSVVATRGGGYALELPREAVDAHRFEQLVAAGRAADAAGDAVGAIELLAEAGSLWRGDALAEFAYEQFAAPEIGRWSELRLAADEERLDLELQRGRHHVAVGELEALVTAHPLRERARGLLMTALYRAGRQADALRVFQEGRRTLADELGLDPGPELRRLEAAILAHDPVLDVPGAVVAEATPPSRRWSVPAALTPLVGREDECRQLTGLVEGHRFVTLVGPGGVGKTRLALDVARRRSASLAAGGCLVELAPVGDPAAVPAAIAAALDVPDASRLVEMIADRQLLLLLDNCEHVIEAAAVIAEDLLRHCPGLQLVATSREGLRVGGETVWPVPPLAIDDAVQLFVERARAGGGRLTPSATVVAAVADICLRLDGLPLAIELAAARTRAFSIEQISSRLHDRFRLLTGGSRTALPRQQTLRAVVDWSYELLFDDEQRVFERLSVFPGGCDLATAESVCADEDLAPSELADTIHALVDKSLVLAVPSGDVPRFAQLQTLAQYGREKLAERGDSERIRDAMAAHFSRLCAMSAAAFIGEDQRPWLIAVDREHDNLRGALEWAVANDDAETALTIAGGTSWAHWLAGTSVEGKRWLDDAFGCRGAASERARALALIGRGLIDIQLGRADGVDADLEEALALCRRNDDVAGTALAYSFYAEVAAARGELDEARRRRHEVLEFYLALPDHPFVLGARAYSQAKLAALDGDLALAERCYRLAADGFSSTDRPMMRTMCLGMIADFEERSGDFEAAIASLEAAVEINDTLGLRGFNGALLGRLGWAQLHHGDAASAELACTRALDLGRLLDHASATYTALSALAVLHRLHGRTDAAVAAATEALDLQVAGSRRRLSNRLDPRADVAAAAAACCVVLAGRAADTGDAEGAARLLGRADGLQAEAGSPALRILAADAARTRRVAAERLGEDATQAAIACGRAGRLDHEVAFRR